MGLDSKTSQPVCNGGLRAYIRHPQMEGIEQSVSGIMTRLRGCRQGCDEQCRARVQAGLQRGGQAEGVCINGSLQGEEA